MRCQGSISRRTRPWQRLVATLLLLLLLTMTGCQGSPARLCRGIRCFNGGSLEVHGSLWGSCRCVCPSGFAGMTCQYWRVGKREAPSSPRPSPRSRLLQALLQAVQDLEDQSLTLSSEDWLSR